METCAISIQSCWSHFKRNWAFNTSNIHAMEEGTQMVITGAIKLAYNRCQHSHKQPGIQKGTSCTPTKSTRHYTEVFQVEQTHQSHCILPIQQQLQTFQGQQANNHSVHTRSWQWYNKFLMHKKLKNWWNKKRLQPSFLSRHHIHLLIRQVFSEGEDDYSNLNFLIKQGIRCVCLQITLQDWLSQQNTQDFIMLGYNY